MTRWEPDAGGRLRQAAMELYVERGFDATTVAEIAERAGLTERTFFRYFADKREVLFDGQEGLLDLFVSRVTGAPASATPLEAVSGALHAVADSFEPGRSWSRERNRVISANPALMERELIKLSTMSGAIAGALRERGVTEPAASLTAESCISVFFVSSKRWLADDNTRTMWELEEEALEALRAVTAL